MVHSRRIYKILSTALITLTLSVVSVAQTEPETVAANNKPKDVEPPVISKKADADSKTVGDLGQSYLKRVGVNVAQTRSLHAGSGNTTGLDE